MTDEYVTRLSGSSVEKVAAEAAHKCLVDGWALRLGWERHIRDLSMAVARAVLATVLEDRAVTGPEHYREGEVFIRLGGMPDDHPLVEGVAETVYNCLTEDDAEYFNLPS